MKPLSERLRETWKLISRRKAWTQGAAARDAEGGAVPPDDPTAVCWCPWGAAAHLVVGWGGGLQHITRALSEQTRGDANIIIWNDSTRRTHDQVKRLFERAIKAAAIEEARAK